MKLRSGCVLDSASYSMCIKGSYFEILIDYGPPVFFLGQNHGVSLDGFFFLYASFHMLMACNRVS